MTYVMIWDPVERTLWGIAFLLSIITTLFYISRARQKENRDEKIILIGMACHYFFTYSLFYVFRYLSDFQIDGYFENGIFYGDLSELNTMFEILYRCSAISWCGGTALFYFSLEKTVIKTKYLLTFIQALFIFLFVILPFDMGLILGVYGLYITLTISGFLLLKLAVWSQLQFKVIVFFLYSAGLLGVYATNFAYIDAKNFNLYPLFLAPLLVIGSATVFLIPLMVDLSRLPKTTAYFYILIVITISGYLITVPIEIINGRTEYLFVGTIQLILSLFMQFYMLKDFKSYTSGLMPSYLKKEKANILGLIAKPQKVTEEEVSVSKEKKICLVCKGKVARNNVFLCPECDTFYCTKCSSTLVSLENACWVCNAPIDPSKPTQPFKEEEEEILLEEKSLKGEKENREVKAPKSIK